MDDPFIQPWNDIGNAAWKDFSEGGNSESCILLAQALMNLELPNDDMKRLTTQ